jgi:DNA-binding beta-propeller fold protein YncE
MTDVTEPPTTGPIAAPPLDGGVAWLNVTRPLTWQDLRGKVVLLDFWTYGCINCMHVLPDLRALEARFRRELVVVGVHSPKFGNERSTENLRRILVRYEIEHPVVNDAEMRIWRAYGAQIWPTRVIVDPAGQLVGTATGEGNLPGFVQAIGTVIRVFEEAGAIDREALPLQLERARLDDSPLLFPGKVLADPRHDRLYISDSNHNRIVIATTAGDVLDVVGSGLKGEADGIFSQARFHRPQGLALDTTTLYVADTENHQVRAIDLEARIVETVAGTGKQGAWSGPGGDATECDLNSPWDLALKPGILIIAMAGPHQIWVVDLVNGKAYPYAGSGQEGRRDGAISEAAFAQPSGLALDEGTLYVADAESNVVRAVALPPVNEVTTLAGGDLFDFGDADGVGDIARFQHPLGVAVHSGSVYVADTYNHRVRVIDPSTRRVTTLAGTGVSGFGDGAGHRAQFAEPGGLSAARGQLFVADTNNHAIRVIDLASREVRTLTLKGLTPPLAYSYLRVGGGERS